MTETITLTKPVTFTSKELGKVTLSTYVDPHPGKVGTDKVAFPCGRCVDKSGYIRAFAHVMGGVCFSCNGAGVVGVSVATLRKHAKRDAFEAEYAAELAAKRNAAVEEFMARKAAEDFAIAWDEAHAENARRDALVQGFLGNEGDKIANVRVTIQVAKYIEGSWNRSSSMFIIAKVDSGHVVKIFGSSATLFGLRRGEVATILTGKVKKHDWHDGQDQTVLSHVKMSEIEEGEED